MNVIRLNNLSRTAVQLPIRITIKASWRNGHQLFYARFRYGKTISATDNLRQRTMEHFRHIK